jgi:cytochrome c553
LTGAAHAAAGLFFRNAALRLPLFLAVLLAALPARADEFNGDFDRGKLRSKAEQCQECHGEAGLGAAEHYPKLAGQHAAYLRKQLGDFQSGARVNAFMTPMAAAISRQDIADIAAYFSASPRWSGEARNFSQTGRALFLDGDSARGLPACASCHGENGVGDAQASSPIPAIAGQSESYLAHQLHAWKAGDRRNSPGDVMNEVARKLSDAEIDEIARYLSGPQAMR